MPAADPTFLLANPDLVAPVAPWCVPLDNLELGVLLLSQPWLAGEHGPRKADLEKQLSRLASDLPLGPVYFQRIKRAVARLEHVGALRRGERRGDPAGRSPRFVSTPEGFAALILNLRLLRSDPTLDASEFEFKRSLVALWNVVLDRSSDMPDGLRFPAGIERFLDEVERIRIHGHAVITADVAGAALDISRLIEAQRVNVEGLARGVRAALGDADDRAGALRRMDLSLLADAGFASAASILAGSPAVLSLVREVASGALPRLGLRARLLRYERYLEYLADLTDLYAGEVRVRGSSSIRDLFETRGS